VSLHEIVLPETEPQTEWVGGRALQKVSPTYAHARLQWLLCTALTQWAEDGRHGRVGIAWRFRVAPPGAVVRPLVPDVGYLAYEALPDDADWDDVQVPLGAPTVAVEVLSPDDRRRNVEHKIRTYLSAGAAAIVVVDGPARTVAVHDASGTRTLRDGDTLTHHALPGFVLDLTELFTRASR